MRRPLRARKPSKRYRDADNPDKAKAALTAVGPGTTSTLIPASAQARTTSWPGSEIVGMPASLTSAPVEPEPKMPTTYSTMACSLC